MVAESTAAAVFAKKTFHLRIEKHLQLLNFINISLFVILPQGILFYNNKTAARKQLSV
jgi:hypothetical protein